MIFRIIYKYCNQIILIFFIILAAGCFSLNASPKANIPVDNDDNHELKTKPSITCPPSHQYSLLHDSVTLNDHNYLKKNNQIRSYIAPALLISGGTVLHFMNGTKEKIRDCAQNNFSYNGSFDDYSQYAPLAAVYLLNTLGIKGQNNFGNRTAIAVKSFLLNGLIADRLKHWTNIERPNGDIRSFPSGHTSTAFMLAHFMHREYGKRSSLYSIGAYSCATTVGILRIAKNAHWISDVLAGAGIGILSTELIYLTHQYKWDNEHLKHFDLFPFSFKKQKGITFVYYF